MHFHLLLFIFKMATKGWFRKFYVRFEQPLPKNAAIIYASSHPNSVIDFLPAPFTANHPINVLVRGDVFENKVLNRIFRWVWMLPVYRIRDGYSTLTRNDESFKECYRAFDKNEHVLIFSEGICIQEKTLQPIKKGTARLALDYVFKHGGDEIYIVPLVSNYTHYRKFRASLTSFFGKPIKASDYRELFDKNPNLAYEQLTADITAEMRKNFIEEKNYKDNSWTEKALEALRLNRLDKRGEWQISDTSFSEEEAKLVQILNEKGEEILSEKFRTEAIRLNLNHTNEGLLKASFGADFYWVQTMLLWPIIAITSLSFLLPASIVNWLLKNKIKDKIFHDTVVVFGNGIMYLLQLIVVSIISLSVFGIVGAWIPTTFVLYTLIWISIIDEHTFARYNWRNIKHKQEFQNLYNEIAEIMQNTAVEKPETATV